MMSTFYLAWRYLVYHRYKTVLLVLTIALVSYIPLGLRLLIRQGQEQLNRRAQTTPVLLGTKGSPLELTLNSLYFRSDVPEVLSYGECDRLDKTGLCRSIPLNVRFKASKYPIVGTSLEYFSFRKLSLKEGNWLSFLGDCVIGAAIARDRGIGPGDSLVSLPENVFDLAGTYPLKMHVTGVLAFSDSPDDHAVFVDLKTTWIIQGLAHGHQDLADPAAASAVLKREGKVIVGNASVEEFTEITPDNISSFHFHGDTEDFPITAVIAVPLDQKSETLLLGRYQSHDHLQVLQPHKVINKLFQTILTIQTFVVTALLLVGSAALITVALLLVLSARQRQREMDTLYKIGGQRGRLAFLLSTEAVFVVVIGGVVTLILTALTGHYGADMVRAYLVQ